MPQFLAQNQWLLILILIWSLIFKGLALWKAARLNLKYWFMALLVINTMGVLEIIFLLFLAKKQRHN